MVDYSKWKDIEGGHFCTKTNIEKGVTHYEFPDEEVADDTAIEAEIARKQNKSMLMPKDYKKLHGRLPYKGTERLGEKTLSFRRRMYGVFGNESKVDPSILWPSKVELEAMSEYESYLQPFTFHELVAKVKEKNELEEKRRQEWEARVMAKVKAVDGEIRRFHKEVALRNQKALELKQKKDRLIEEVRRNFGYEIDVKDEKFKAALQERQKEEKKIAKEEKKAKRALAKQAKIEAKETPSGSDPISDDEDDTHPNIDTPSLFRWRHQARVERMNELKTAREIQNQKMHDNRKKLKDTMQKIEEAKKSGCKLSELTKALEELEKEAEELKAKDDELVKKERLTPWNVDTISHSGFSKTVLNTKPKANKEELTDEEREEKLKKFIKDHEKDIKKFGMLQKYDDSKRFLQDHLYLVCEETANYLVIWCINLQMEDKGNLMEHVAHQCICMQYILELSKHLDVDPRACVGSFFSRIQVGDVDYKQSFDDELHAFKERIRKRAQEKLEVIMKEVEEEEKQARLGPGGLDPIEVLESLPEELKKCFETKDIPLLQTTIANMPEEEARYHMKRCVDSGLWLPDGGAKKEEDEAA